jgi:predicted Fe-Mo cluster-binding NifX family protein
MKVVISSDGKDLSSNVSEVFGRCPYFIIAEIKDKKIVKFEAISNTVANQRGGAGISAARLVVEKGAKAVITHNLGPRAYEVLKQFNIAIYNSEGNVREVLQKFIDGKLKKF